MINDFENKDQLVYNLLEDLMHLKIRRFGRM
jgi:hypothetical protein